jgi:hypothetical protein
MYKILVLLLLPLSLNGTVTYKNMPSSFNILDDLNAQFMYRFKDWYEMKKDPDVSVEEYRKYIGIRCAGLYEYLTERKNLNVEFTASLNNKIEFMEAVINHNLFYLGEAEDEKARMWALVKKAGFKGYYRILHEHEDKYFVKLDNLSNDIQFCEKYYKNNFID